MKLVIVACFVGLAVAVPLELPKTLEGERPRIVTDYHLEIGIPLAARIKAAEEAADFSGSRIVGGSPTVLGQYPHLGGLVIPLNSGGTSACGSSLISNTKVLTAAHCWESSGALATEFEVVLGSVRLFSGGTRIVTRDVILHPGYDYNRNIAYNDIAVATIRWVDFNDVIRSIPLARGNDYFVGKWAWAAGFGVQKDGAGISTDQSMHHVHVQVILNQACWQVYPGYVFGSTLCTSGAGGRGTCSVDSGGPLEAEVDGVRILIGVTSFGYTGGCEAGFPAAFARVSSYNAWIRGLM